MATAASLIKWLAFSGAHTVTSAPVATGSIYFYVPGSTSVAVTVYADEEAASPLTQPVALDAAGRAVVYISTPADIVIKDSTGASVRTISYGEGVDSGLIWGPWDGGSEQLAVILDEIETFMETAASDVPADSIHEEVISTADPSFEFNPLKTINYFHATYAGVSTSLTITWPAPAPTLVRGTRYTIIIHGHDAGGGVTCASSVVFPTEIETSTPPTSILTLKSYSAEFLSRTGSLVQVSPWVATSGNAF